MNPNYTNTWKKLEAERPCPHFFRDAKFLDFEEFRDKVYSEKGNSLIESIYNGYIYILKNTLTLKTLKTIQKKIQHINETKPVATDFIKSDHNCPNFHFVNNPDYKDSSKYYVVDHSYFFSMEY
jgi:hypothetical protein